MNRYRLEFGLKRLCGWMSALALFVIMWLMFFDVLGRYFASKAIPGGLELIEMLMVVVIFGALPLVSWKGEHVVFDSLDEYITEKLRKLQGLFVHVLSGGVFLFMAYQMLKRAERFAEYGEVTPHLELPMAPVAWFMAIFISITALAHFVLGCMSITGTSKEENQGSAL